MLDQAANGSYLKIHGYDSVLGSPAVTFLHWCNFYIEKCEEERSQIEKMKAHV